MDDEILKTVHSIFGKSVQIVDCEKTSSKRQEEVLLINGIPVTLDGHDSEEIKNALLTGQVPSVELLNQLLYQAGILKQSVQLETSLSVKSSMVTTEEVSVARGGQIVDGRSSETKEDYVYSSSKKEIWKPITTKKVTTTETMSHTARFPLSNEQQPTESSCEGAVGGEKYEVNGSATSAMTSEPPQSGLIRPSTTSCFTSESLGSRSGSSRKYQYDYKVQGNCDENDDEYDDDDDDDDDDEDGELYLLNPSQYSGAAVSEATAATTPSFTNRLPPIRNATTTISNSSTATTNSNDDLLRKYQKAPSQSGRKSSLLSFDSGHDGAFHSPSQQTCNNLSAPVQQLTKNNTDHSISSCYDFISSDEADFLTATNNSSINVGNNCKTVFATHERSYADLQQQQQRELSSHFSSSSYDKNVKSPTLGKKLSMSSSSCMSTNPLSSHPKQQQQQHGAINKTSANNIDPSSDDAAAVAAAELSSTTVTLSTISSTTSVQNGLVFRDGNLISGPLDDLIAHMVPSAQYYPDRSFIFSFLLSARLFIRPHELLARISDTWENQQQQQIVQPSIDTVDEKYSSHPQTQSMSASGGKSQMYQFADEQMHQKAMKSAQNCIQLLSEWIDTFPYDFRDERLMQHVRVLARKCVYIDNNLGKTVSSILQQLVQRLTVLEKYEEFLQTLTANESNEQQTNEVLAATHYQKPYSSTASSASHCGGGQTNSGYVHASSTSSSSDRDDINASLLVDASNAHSQATAFSSLVGIPPHKSLSSSYTTASGTCHQHQLVHHHHHHHHNSHQSDSSSNSVNTLGPGGGGGMGIGISGCTSFSGTLSNGGELTGICDLCPNAALLAHQLTHIELERLSHIGPEEFVQAFAKENHLESFSDMKKTRNLESYVQWFNRLSYFTATEIVKYPKKKQRVRIIEFWIETARECFNIGNFNSLMAIIAGLNLSPISRLKKTWSKIQSAKFSVLEHQMDPTSNFNSYRSTLKAAMWRSEGATNERERIIIPFFSLLVKDLYFLNEGCSNRLPNGHINFEKFWQLAKQVMEFNTWKKVTCPFEKLPKVIMFLQLSTVLNENTLSMASFECEPPENTQEKGRYKTLKSETKQQQQQQHQQQT